MCDHHWWLILKPEKEADVVRCRNCKMEMIAPRDIVVSVTIDESNEEAT